MGKALIGSNGVNLQKLMLPEVASLVIVCLQVEEVKSLLTCAKDQWDGVAVPQGELQLHVDLLRRLASDPVGAKPVVLAVLHHIADLEGPDGGVVLVHTTDLLPLQQTKRGRGRKEKQREAGRNKRTEIQRIKKVMRKLGSENGSKDGEKRRK